MNPKIKIEKKESNISINVYAGKEKLMFIRVANINLLNLKKALEENTDLRIHNSHKAFGFNRTTQEVLLHSSQLLISWKLSETNKKLILSQIDNILNIVSINGYIHEDYVLFRNKIDRDELLNQIEKRNIQSKSKIGNGRLNIMVEKTSLDRYLSRRDQKFLR